MDLKIHENSRAPFGDQKTVFYFFAKDSADRKVENRRQKKIVGSAALRQRFFFAADFRLFDLLRLLQKNKKQFFDRLPYGGTVCL